MYPDGSVYTGFFKNGVKHGQGTYLFGNGSYHNPWPMDIQGAIDAPEVVNGAELVLHPGVWAPSAMAGPGRVVDLSLRGKLLSLVDALLHPVPLRAV